MAQGGSRKSARRTAAGPTARASKRPSGGGTKYVYSFAGGKAEGSSALRNLLGGKGCELAEMTKMGVPVPPGFTITTEAWAAYDAAGKKHPAGALDPGHGAPRPPREPPRAVGWATRSGRCWYRSARARAPRCPA